MILVFFSFKQYNNWGELNQIQFFSETGRMKSHLDISRQYEEYILFSPIVIVQTERHIMTCFQDENGLADTMISVLQIVEL